MYSYTHTCTTRTDPRHTDVARDVNALVSRRVMMTKRLFFIIICLHFVPQCLTLPVAFLSPIKANASSYLLDESRDKAMQNSHHPVGMYLKFAGQMKNLKASESHFPSPAVWKPKP